MAFQVLGQSFGHRHEMPEQSLQSFATEQQQIAKCCHRPGSAAAGFECVLARVVLAGLEQVRHFFRVASNQRQVMPRLRQKQTGDVRCESCFVKVDAQRVGQGKLTDPPLRSGQRPNGARSKALRVFNKVVAVKDAPRPADNRVGVNVRHIVKGEFVDQPVSDAVNLGEVVQAERVGRSHRRDDHRDLLSRVQSVPAHAFEQAGADFVFVGAGNFDNAVFAQPYPAGNRSAGVMSTFGSNDDGGFSNAGLHRSGAGFFKTDSSRVKQGARPTESKDALSAGRIVANKIGSHGGDFDLGESN